jgi:hypothetical protein
MKCGHRRSRNSKIVCEFPAGHPTEWWHSGRGSKGQRYSWTGEPQDSGVLAGQMRAIEGFATDLRTKVEALSYVARSESHLAGFNDCLAAVLALLDEAPR